MDTKSKSCKYSYAMKVSAILLALMLGFSSAFFALLTVENVYLYGVSVLTKPAQSQDVTQTASFSAQVIDNLQSVSLVHFTTWESYRSEALDTFEQELENAETTLERVKQTAMASAVARYYSGNEQAQDAQDGDIQEATMPATAVSGEWQVMPNYDEAYYTSYSETYYLVSDTRQSYPFTMRTKMTTAELRKEVSEKYAQLINAVRRRYETAIHSETQEIENIKNLKFYIANPDTGEVFTNLGEGSSVEAVQANARWYVAYTAGNGLVQSSAQVNEEAFYSSTGRTKRISSGGYIYSSTWTSMGDMLDSEFAEKGFDVYLALENEMVPGDIYYTMQQNIESSAPRTYTYMLLSLIFLLLTGILSVYLLFVTGRVRGKAGIVLGPPERIPTDLHLGISMLLVSGGVAIIAICLSTLVGNAFYVAEDGAEKLMLFVVMSLDCAAIWGVVQEWLCSTAKLHKSSDNWLQRMLLYRFVLWALRLVKRLFRSTRRGILLLRTKTQRLRKKIFWAAAAYLAGNTLLALLIASGSDWTLFYILALGAYNLCVFSIIWRYVLSLDKIIIAAENTKDGTPVQLDEKMPDSLRGLAENLSFTQETMQKAVNEAVKGERMKTELITNVSHDLKTPLTSIISYVDLLKKCDIDDISAQKYITVLDEKSIRLKRLIEDLVEASKASSGAIVFQKMNVNFYELAVQAIGEMADVFARQQLEIVLNEPTDPPVIFADSQKTWRIIDNLLSNVKKYALEGTRVYIDVRKEEDFGVVTVKNTSRDALNIDPDELTNRFVRGDESRTLEGSGLGLSIAKDLCVLQGGQLKLEIDGDLFKATVKMPLAPKREQPETVLADSLSEE